MNFHERQGEECLAANVDAVLGMIRDKYREYGIDETPFVIVKADAGTYGMGVMTVKDAEVTGLNRKQRNKMSVVKGRHGGLRGHHPGGRPHPEAGQRRRRRAGGIA